MPLTTEQTKIRLKRFLTFWKENQEELAIEELSGLFIELNLDREKYVERSELRELIIEIREGFRRMDERFLAMDKRFEAVDRRFEELLRYIDKRFESVDKRFEAMDKRFEEQLHYMDKRFEDINKRFEEQQLNMNKRFEEQQLNMNKRFEEQLHYMDKRFEDMNKRFNFFQWFVGILMTVFFTLITYTNQKQTELILNQLQNSQKVIIEQNKGK